MEGAESRIGLGKGAAQGQVGEGARWLWGLSCWALVVRAQSTCVPLGIREQGPAGMYSMASAPEAF